MAIKITRKNNGLNNALRGAERGINNGMQIGMQMRRQAQDEQESQTRQRLALQQAARIGQQIDMEMAERAAAQEGIAATAADYANDPSAALDAGMKAGPGVAMAVGSAQQDKWGKLGEIARRMDPAAARLFLQDAKARDVAATQERARNQLRDEITEKRRQGAYKTDPESAAWLDPQEVAEGDAMREDAAGKLTALLADPNSNPKDIAEQESRLSRSSILAEGTSGARAQFFQGLTDQANAAMQASGGMFSPAQGKRIRTMMSAFRQTPRMYDDPKAMAEFQAAFADALQGYTKVGDQRIRFEDEQAFRKMAMENAVLKNREIEQRIAESKAQEGAYGALATQRANPTAKQAGAETEGERLKRATEYRKIAENPDTATDQKDRYRKMAEALESPGSALIDDVKQRTGIQNQGGIQPPAAETDIAKAIEDLRKITDPAEREAAMRAKAKELARGRD